MQRQLITIGLWLVWLGQPAAQCWAQQGEDAKVAECGQINLPQVEKMPNIPQPFKMRDWKQVARDFDALVFDFNAKGEHFPLVWIDKSHINNKDDGFGIPTTIGDPRMGPDIFNGAAHGGFDCMGAVLGATYAGIDKSDQHGYNFVNMCKDYFHTKSGRNMVLYWTEDKLAPLGGGMQFDFWVDIMPNELFGRLVHSYPDEKELTEILRKSAERWYEADRILAGNYKWSYFDFKEMKPKMSSVGKQPDAAGGIALILFRAYRKFGDEKYLKAAEAALTWLNGETKNWFYENGMYYAAYLTARLNAEYDKGYNIDKILNWVCCNKSDKWGPSRRVIVERWGDCDAYGLSAACNPHRAYAMETFYTTAFIVPLVRYDQRYARAVGKWMLNLANASRLFYGSEIPDDYQSYPQYRGDVKRCIGYEAVQCNKKGKPYYADRDNWNVHYPETFAKHFGMDVAKLQFKYPRASQYSLYGSGYVGFLGGIIERTDHSAILQLDCVKLDVFHDKAYPTYLYFNPYKNVRKISVDVGDKAVDLYDTVARLFVRKNVKGKTSVTIKADSAAVIVHAPADGKVTYDGNKMLINGVVVDYRYSL